MIQHIASYSENIIMFLWLPVLIWTALALAGWGVLRVLPNVHPQFHYRGRLAMILALPAGLISLLTLQGIEKIWFTESAVPTLKFVTLTSPVEINAVMVLSDQTESLLWYEWVYAFGMLIFMTGVLLLAFRLVKQLLDLKRLKKSLNLIRIDTFQNLDKDNRRTASEYQRGIFLAFSDNDIIPVTFGYRRPVILLPESLRNDPVKLNLSIRHELTHITQNDFIIHSLVLVTQLMFWYHPVIHVIKKELVDYREMRCDSLVLSEAGVSRKKYASLLLELLPMTNINKELSVNMAQESSNLKKRIQMIAQQSRSKPIPKRASLAIFAFALLGTAIAMACTDLQTQQVFDNEELNILTDLNYDGTRDYHQIIIYMSDDQQAERHKNLLEKLEQLQPEPIEVVEVLKGDHAIEVFGERGANGVIRIQTRRDAVAFNSVLRTLGMEEMDIENPPRAPVNPDHYELDNNIYIDAEQMPELIGGLESILRDIRYPEEARQAGIEGRVYVQFVVNKQGYVENARVIRGIGGGADEEALRVVQNAKFRPGLQNGEPVDVVYSLPIFFRLNNQQQNQTNG